MKLRLKKKDKEKLFSKWLSLVSNFSNFLLYPFFFSKNRITLSETKINFLDSEKNVL